MPPLDLSRVKEAASFEQVLAHYGVRLLGAGAQRMALCPFHADSRPSCSVNLDRKVFHCFGCGTRGSVLDFVAGIEGVPIPEAAAQVTEICGLAIEGAHRRSVPPGPPGRAASKRQSCETAPVRPARLTLDPSHPYLAARGIGPALAETFGLGYCSRGVMKRRICIPIHDERGMPLAYAGRWASESVPDGVPRYLLPRGFQKARVLFNLHRVAGSDHVIVVEGYWSVFRLHALGFSAAALMGRSMSARQQELLASAGVRRVSLLLDGDPPGLEATAKLVPELARQFFVRAIALPDGAEPDTVSEKILIDVLCSSH